MGPRPSMVCSKIPLSTARSSPDKERRPNTGYSRKGHKHENICVKLRNTGNPWLQQVLQV